MFSGLWVCKPACMLAECVCAPTLECVTLWHWHCDVSDIFSTRHLALVNGVREREGWGLCKKTLQLVFPKGAGADPNLYSCRDCAGILDLKSDRRSHKTKEETWWIWHLVILSILICDSFPLFSLLYGVGFIFNDPWEMGHCRANLRKEQHSLQ